MPEDQKNPDNGGGRAAGRDINLLWVLAAVVLVVAIIIAARSFRQGEIASNPSDTAPKAAIVEQTRDDGMSMFNRGQIKESVPKLESYIKQKPDDVQARTALALAYTALSKPNEALGEYEAILEKDPKDGPTLYRTGLLLQQLDKPRESVEYLEKAVAVDSKNSTFHAELAKAYAQEKQYEKALAEWSRVLELTAPKDPYRGSIHGQMGDIYLALEQPAKAKSAYKTGLTFDPDSKYLRQQLARVGG